MILSTYSSLIILPTGYLLDPDHFPGINVESKKPLVTPFLISLSRKICSFLRCQEEKNRIGLPISNILLGKFNPNARLTLFRQKLKDNKYHTLALMKNVRVNFWL